jgi:hypothetical protein
MGFNYAPGPSGPSGPSTAAGQSRHRPGPPSTEGPLFSTASVEAVAVAPRLAALCGDEEGARDEAARLARPGAAPACRRTEELPIVCDAKRSPAAARGLGGLQALNSTHS